ncbi:MAG: hypothetical protein M0P73_08930 [Syntrophobacterales bacterium]|jgi:hypothetical protein|nr:hypothetical protein [Syntrophobacterales bacterium]
MMTLEEKLDALVQIVLRARTFFDLWWIYEGAPTRSKYLPSMNRYSEFFRFDIHAQLITYTMYFCQVFENNQRNMNIKHVVNKAKNRGVSTGYIAAAEKALKEGLAIREKLAIVRNKLFAHRDASLSYSEAFKKADITPDEIRRLSELGLEAINSLRTALGQKKQGFSILPGKDLEELLEEISSRS